MHGFSDEMPCAYNQNTYYTNVPTANLEMVQDFLSRDCLVLPLILSTHTSPPTVEISKTIFEDCRISTSSTPKEDCIREYSQYQLPPLNGYFNMKKRKNYEDHQLDRATEIKRHFSTGNEKKEVVPSISSTNNVQESIHQFDDSNATVYQFQLMTKYQDLSHFPV
ncbi:uncharacterized protein LOC124938894 [Impatiens glandulifera]|uniref:uncharacterized protein LOC124938894 n=1 Tax=Impatiens glandulifera TaxID=253017 RepID=UPI001FB0D404|nr:uncharacterized protein LOC124938894 [Impatiens glandulifera]